jgi:hypothetical protein
VPGSVEIAAFTFGAILVLLALLGGTFKAFGFEISGRVGTPLRVAAGVIGVIFLLGALYPTLRPEPSSPKPEPADKPGLDVDYHVDEQGASLIVGNGGDGGGIIIVSQLTAHWEYKKCPELIPGATTSPGTVMAMHKYELRLSTSDGSHVVDPRKFRYKPGQAEEFVMELKYPSNGIYTIWLSFNYKTLGDGEGHVYKTSKETNEVCAEFSR